MATHNNLTVAKKTSVGRGLCYHGVLCVRVEGGEGSRMENSCCCFVSCTPEYVVMRTINFALYFKGTPLPVSLLHFIARQGLPYKAVTL